MNFKKFATITTLGLASTVTSTAYAADLPEFTATYAINANGTTGTATRKLVKNGNQYKYTVTGSAARIATLNQEASFSLSGNQILPASASASTKFLGIGNTHKVKFNNQAKTVVSTYKNKSQTLSMPRQAFDDLSMEAQIRQELINGKFTGSYPLVKKTDIETTRFKRIGNSKITVPAGTYEVVRFDRLHQDKNRVTSFWLAPSLNYLPIKVSQNDDGKVISMELTKVH